MQNSFYYEKTQTECFRNLSFIALRISSIAI